MTKVIARVHPVHLVDWAPGGRQHSDQASWLGLRVRRKLAAIIHIHHRQWECRQWTGKNSTLSNFLRRRRRRRTECPQRAQTTLAAQWVDPRWVGLGRPAAAALKRALAMYRNRSHHIDVNGFGTLQVRAAHELNWTEAQLVINVNAALKRTCWELTEHETT